MAVFRIEKTKDYTIMSNHHLRNKEMVNPILEEPSRENPAQSITKEKRTEILNKDPSINPEYFDFDVPKEFGNKIGNLRQAIIRQIESDVLCRQYGVARLNEIVELMLERTASVPRLYRRRVAVSSVVSGGCNPPLTPTVPRAAGKALSPRNRPFND